MSRKVGRFYYKLCIVSLKNYKSKLCVILFDVILLRKQEHSEKPVFWKNTVVKITPMTDYTAARTTLEKDYLGSEIFSSRLSCTVDSQSPFFKQFFFPHLIKRQKKEERAKDPLCRGSFSHTQQMIVL